MDSRNSNSGMSVRRRRICAKCKRRFTTFENVVDKSIWVIKKDGRKELFERSKVIEGLLIACNKRPVNDKQVDMIVIRIEKDIIKNYNKEIPSYKIGEVVLKELKKVDKIAYVRFASVYRQFKDVKEFIKEASNVHTRQ